MDRNSAIGLTLIAALLLVYFYWFSPQPQPPAEQKSATESTPKVASDSLKSATAIQQQKPDSVLAASYGDLSGFVNGLDSTITIETEDIKVIFSNKGGKIQELELKKYKSYRQYVNKESAYLKLVSPDRSSFNLLTTYQGKAIDLYTLYYQAEQSKKGDTTLLSYTIKLANGSSIRQTYAIPPQGFEIKYSIEQQGFDQQLSGDNLTFQWNETIKPIEKDLQETRINTTITYFTPADGVDKLDLRSTSTETEVFSEPVQWVAIKQKFFLSSIIAENNNFSGGELTTTFNPADTSIVKNAKVKLLIPLSAVAKGTADFKFYIGPNDYQIIKKVSEKFAKNVDLGWPPVYWINKFVIFPVFNFLTKFISSYGLIIIILVLLLKLVLFPLSYRSYLSMAKMKVLKPDLDVIKEKHGEDMTKVQQEQLKLYQQVGVNPISGCIPVLLQMPILFAMFYLFPASIELRQQPLLWAEDLSTYDSILTLPFTVPFLGDHLSLFTLLMTISTLIYTWQNNQLSSVQGPMKSMSYIMPVIFLFVLNSFSAGLTFYYFISNLVTFAQQALIRKFVDEDKIKALLEENRKKNLSGTGGKKSKFMSKLEDAMKASEENRKRAEEERKKRKK
jgi:YidC/Oxa1 family membrane protein insertase